MLRLLIVDDDIKRGDELRLLSERLGFAADEVVVANTREQAEASLAGALLAEPFKFAVIDVALRSDLDEEGIDFMRDLLARHPRCRVICLTGHRPEAKQRALDAGATFFIDIRSEGRDWRERFKEKLRILRSLNEKVSSPA